MNYNEAMKYIEGIGKFGSNYGLERTLRILEHLNNPHKDLKFIHIAGTNGKGSTTAMIAEILKEKGFKVGMYTSPFLEEFEERIQINGVNIPKETLTKLIEKVKDVVDVVIEEGYGQPTEFEIITCIMLLYFKNENIDYGVIEVGLGGRLDSTNVITPILSIITSISFDHTNILGNTLEEIAGEKAGIIKSRVPVLVYNQSDSVLNVIKKVADEKNSKVYVADFEKCQYIKTVEEENGVYQVVKIDNDFEIKLSLLGEHQIKNAYLAIKAAKIISEVEHINISSDDIIKALYKVKWIGRLELLANNPKVVIDGAHNIDGIRQLRRNVEKYFKYKKVNLILGILADKDVEEMVKEITPIASKVYAVTPHSDRAQLADELKKSIIKYNSNCESFNDYELALNEALKDSNKDDLVLISGSLYMIGDMRKIIRKRYSEIR